MHNYVNACYSSPWQLSLCNAKCKIARAFILKSFDILTYNSKSLWSGFKVLFLLKSSQKFYPCLALSAFKGPSIRSAIQPTKRHLIQFICRAIFQTESLCCLCICFPRLIDWWSLNYISCTKKSQDKALDQPVNQQRQAWFNSFGARRFKQRQHLAKAICTSRVMETISGIVCNEVHISPLTFSFSLLHWASPQIISEVGF